MRKRSIILNIIFTSLIIIAMLVAKLDYDKKVYDREEKRFIAVQQKRVSLYVHENAPSSKEIKFTKYEQIPSGDYFNYGYINNDRSLNFSALAASTSNYQFNVDIEVPEKLHKLIKKRSERKSVDQIIKEKHLNPKDYEYPWP